jgi:hypothetical protein
MTLPCIGNADLYDALFDDVPEGQRQAAQAKAAALCGRCPSPCPQKVTPDAQARTLQLLPTGWMPAATEGRPEPETPAFGKRRTRQDPLYGIGFDYIRPNKRVQTWARMAAERAAQGCRLSDIALDLCVTEDTAQRLIDMASQKAA